MCRVKTDSPFSYQFDIIFSAMNIESIIQTIGLLGIFIIIFAESGLFVGFFLPGDSILFTAGFLASQNIISLPALILVCFVAAVSGDSVGYTFGRKVGKKIFNKEDSLLFHKDHIRKAQEFYKKYGVKTIVIARFIPVVRTFAPIVAGVAEMHYQTFLTFNLIGGLLWATGLNLAGYFLGKTIPNVDKYLLPIIFLIVIISIAPNVIHVAKDEEMKKSIAKEIKKLISKINK